MSVDLVYYASKGNLWNVRSLLEHGILPDATNSNGETALFHAALEGHVHVVEELMKYGADPNRCSVNGLSPVNAACYKDNVKSLAVLIYHGGRLDHPALSESAIVTAHRYQSKRVKKYITKIREEALMNFTGDFMEMIDEEEEENKSIQDKFQPGSCSSVPSTGSNQLSTLHEGVRFSFLAPDVTFRSACWNSVPVTVKTSNSKETTKKDLQMLCYLRHPHVAMILAGFSSPITGLTGLVLDYFKFGNLHHVLYKSKLDLSLAKRINILSDISKAMVFVHCKKILHCYINSYSILIDEGFRAKIGNFQHAQKIDDETETQPIVDINNQHPWMAPGQLNGENANQSSDIYSFGALFWECLATKKPWSWLTNKSIFQALCEECLRLPQLQDWPRDLRNILSESIGPEQERSDFETLSQHLDIIRTSDLEISGEVLEGAFEYWLTGNRRIKKIRKISVLKSLASKLSRNISALDMDSDSEDEDDTKVCLLTTRRRSSMMGLNRHRRNTIHQGLYMNMLNSLHNNKRDSRKERDTEKYGPEVAEQLTMVRNMWKIAKNHVRHRWAKEMSVRRKLEGDIQRIKIKKRHNDQNCDLKARQSKRGQRVRKLSHGAQSIARLRTIAYKYDKWDWARYTTGHQYLPPEDKYELSEEPDDDEETVVSRDVLKKDHDENPSDPHVPALDIDIVIESKEEDEAAVESGDENVEKDGENAVMRKEHGNIVDALEENEKTGEGEGQLQQVNNGKVHQQEDEEDDDDNKEQKQDEMKEEEDKKEDEIHDKRSQSSEDETECKVAGVESYKSEQEDQNNDSENEPSCTNKAYLDNKKAGNDGESQNSNDSAENHRNSQTSNTDSEMGQASTTESTGNKSFSSDAANILDEFSKWLDDYCEEFPSSSDLEENFQDTGEGDDIPEASEQSSSSSPEFDKQIRTDCSSATLLDDEPRASSKESNISDNQPITAKLSSLSNEEKEISKPSKQIKR